MVGTPPIPLVPYQSENSIPATGMLSRTQVLAWFTVKLNPYWLPLPPPGKVVPFQVTGFWSIKGLLTCKRMVTGATEVLT